MQTTVLEYLERDRAAKDPAKVVLVDPARTYTFAELERSAKSCAWLLLERADVMRRPIAVLLPRDARTVIADIGILFSGNLYANLDPASPPARLRAVLDTIDPALVITCRELEPLARTLGIPVVRRVVCDDFAAGAGFDEAALRRRVDQLIDTDPLCIISTSGSTGVPKCVVLSHRAMIDFADWCMDRLALDGSARVGCLSPFHFDLYTLELNLCMAKAATLVIIPDGTAAFPPVLLEHVTRHAVSLIFWVPSIMVNIANLGLLERHDLRALRTILFAGEVFPTKHLNRWRRALPDATFVNLYGPIETAVDSTYYIVERELADDEPLPIGAPCRNTAVLLLDEHDRPCAPGSIGELCIRGSSLAMGYWNDPERTARAFVQNPLNPHYPELIYRTGDLAYRNDRGELMFAGRRDYQIKHMGYRIELPEIEHATLAIPGVANACVLYDREHKAITLFYEAAPAVTPAVIRKGLALSLPKYMLPTAFHRLEQLPRNANGKIDRDGLGRRLAGGEVA